MSKLYRKSFVANHHSKRQIFQVGLTALFLLLLFGYFLAPTFASAATSDTSGDVEQNLIKQGWYISNTAKAPGHLKDPTGSAKILQDTVNELKSKKHPAALAILDNTTMKSGFSTASAYAEYLRGYISPKVDIVVVVNGDTKQVGLSAANLTSQEQQAITDASRSTFTAGSFAEGVQKVALDAEAKISSNGTSGLLVTVGIIVLVLLVVGGCVTYVLLVTKKNFQRQLQSLETLNGQVSDLVVRVSDGIDYLPDQTRDQARSSFGQATANMSEAQSGLHELQKASSIQLLLGGGKYRQQLNNTDRQLRTSLNLLQQLDRSVEKTG